jgi:hypothetical protein
MASRQNVIQVHVLCPSSSKRRVAFIHQGRPAVFRIARLSRLPVSVCLLVVPKSPTKVWMTCLWSTVQTKSRCRLLRVRTRNPKRRFAIRIRERRRICDPNTAETGRSYPFEEPSMSPGMARDLRLSTSYFVDVGDGSLKQCRESGPCQWGKISFRNRRLDACFRENLHSLRLCKSNYDTQPCVLIGVTSLKRSYKRKILRQRGESRPR